MQEQQTIAQRPKTAASNPVICLHQADNVVVARATLLPGTPVEKGVSRGPANPARTQGGRAQDRGG